jgi:hypothetical protein
MRPSFKLIVEWRPERGPNSSHADPEVVLTEGRSIIRLLRLSDGIPSASVKWDNHERVREQVSRLGRRKTSTDHGRISYPFMSCQCPDREKITVGEHSVYYEGDAPDWKHRVSFTDLSSDASKGQRGFWTQRSSPTRSGGKVIETRTVIISIYVRITMQPSSSMPIWAWLCQ